MNPAPGDRTLEEPARHLRVTRSWQVALRLASGVVLVAAIMSARLASASPVRRMRSAAAFTIVSRVCAASSFDFLND